ncbi:MAG: thioesterase family protein [Gammaproteobacteria bacterium]|nr:thioesterase family protein [Gammaproteobacteria bacterium]MBT8094663.1 thioesterase family protein [Gammaproteobacteria bacterium]MBT8105831.1 thioesterase family protein [Gammaproteobacteria bacterium]NNK25845.1 thioesterase family protein [Woeseiaceae bacterium]NNL64168.1 thioesterase family protein [Woeseiaceae bacterium]
MDGVEVTRGRVLPEWIDVNDHMNVAYYLLAFDRAVDALWARFGLTEDYVRTHDSSTIAVESHVTWQREVFEGDPYLVTAQLLAYDDKRIHQFQRLYHADEGFLAATCEWMNLHFDPRIRRVAPWPEEIRARIAEFADNQGSHRWPSEAGSRMRVQQPIYSASRNERQ